MLLGLGEQLCAGLFVVVARCLAVVALLSVGVWFVAPVVCVRALACVCVGACVLCVRALCVCRTCIALRALSQLCGCVMAPF